MRNVLSLRTTVLGFLSWAIPFAASFAFFDRAGQLAVAQPLFKSAMVVIGGGVGTLLLVRAFRSMVPTAKAGAVLGLYWLAINLAFDLVVLLPIMKVSVGAYLQDIGLRYLLLPIVAAGMGAVIDDAKR